jgi:hypothetical protein
VAGPKSRAGLTSNEYNTQMRRNNGANRGVHIHYMHLAYIATIIEDALTLVRPFLGSAYSHVQSLGSAYSHVQSILFCSFTYAATLQRRDDEGLIEDLQRSLLKIRHTARICCNAVLSAHCPF